MKATPQHRTQEMEALDFISNELQEEFTSLCFSLDDAIVMD